MSAEAKRSRQVRNHRKRASKIALPALSATAAAIPLAAPQSAQAVTNFCPSTGYIITLSAYGQGGDRCTGPYRAVLGIGTFNEDYYSVCAVLKGQKNGGGPNLPSAKYVSCAPYYASVVPVYSGYPTIINHSAKTRAGFRGSFSSF